MYKATSRWLGAAMAAMLFVAGCGSMEEDGAVTIDEEEVASAEQAALVPPPPPPSCPSGYFKLTNPACDSDDTPCFKCCRVVKGVPPSLQCYESPTCIKCPWNLCGCLWTGLARAVTCYTTTEFYGWTFIYVWKCAMSNGTTCTYNYYTRQLLYCA